MGQHRKLARCRTHAAVSRQGRRLPVDALSPAALRRSGRLECRALRCRPSQYLLGTGRSLSASSAPSPLRHAVSLPLLEEPPRLKSIEVPEAFARELLAANEGVEVEQCLRGRFVIA